MFHQNVQCISNCKANLEVVIDNNKYHVLALTEHWQTDGAMESFQFRNYRLANKYCRRSATAHGGVALYVIDSLDPISRDDITMLSEEYVLECSAVEVKVAGVQYVVCVMYNPSVANFDTFVKKLDQIIELIMNENKTIIILGDFNVDMLSETKLNKNKIIHVLNSYNMIYTIKEPTRVTDNSSTCIDNIYVSEFVDQESSVIKTNISDHFGQVINIFGSENCSHQGEEFEYKRIYNSENYAKLYELLASETWVQVYEASAVNDQYNYFIAKLSEYCNLAFPIKKIKVRRKQQFEWISDNIRHMKETLDFLLELLQSRRITSDFYTDYKRYYTQTLLEEKKKFYKAKVAESDNKPKTVWNIIKNENGKVKSNYHIFGGINHENKIIYSPRSASDVFNDYFVNVASNLIGSHAGSCNINNVKSNPNSLFLSFVTEEEILNIIGKLKNKTSVGEDNISNILVKKIKNYIVSPIAFIVNKSFESGCFPDRLKMAVVRPILKGGNSLLIENFRPISLLSSFSKIFELAMYNRLISFLNKNDLITSNQHGFQNNRSTITAIFSFMTRLLNFLDEGSVVHGVFLDLSKAFDCVQHGLLLQKMERMGIRGLAHDWFKSYLLNRSQRVCIRSECKEYLSRDRTITVGVPQGSILGPILFILYINDLETVVESSSILITKYADDTNVLITGKNYETLKERTVSVIDELANWFKGNSLSLNMKKTDCIHFEHSRSNNVFPDRITLNNAEIAYNYSTKFLGLKIDKHLNWSEQVDMICSKLGRACYALKELKKVADSSTLLAAYYGYFHSVMRYGLIFWGAAGLGDVFIMQKRAVRILANLKVGDSCRGSFRTLGVMTLPALFVYECVCFVYRNKHLFNNCLADHAHDTRRKLYSYNYPLHRTTLFERGGFYQCLKMFNLLPDSIKSITPFMCFKRTVKRHLMDAEPYEIASITEDSFR